MVPDWARMGSLLVPTGAAEAAARSGRAVKVYPDGLEALSGYELTAGDSGPSAMTRRVSQSGVEPSSGIIDTIDHNRKLTPSIWRGDDREPGVVDQIVREDPVGKAIKLSWCLPITRSAWSIEPNGDDARALEIAAFVRANLWEHLRGGFYPFIEHAASMVWRGFALSEIVVKFDKEKQQTLLDNLAPILPRTVDGWLRYPGEGWGIQQYQYQGDNEARGVRPPGSGVVPNLAPSKLVHFVWDADADSPEGTSILRPCYAGWKQRRLYLKLEAAGFERGAFGIPFLTIDPSARQADSSIANEILRELRTGARAWATFPPGYTLQFADFPMKGAEIREARIAAGQDMARAALTTFLFTGEKAGAFSLIRGQQDFFQLALQSAADSIASVLSSGANSLIKRLVSWNFDGVDQFPKLVPGSISLGDPVGLVNAIRSAADGSLLTPDEGIEESIRSALGLPEMPEQTVEQWRHQIKGDPQEIVGPPDPAPAKAKESEVSDDDRGDAEDEGSEIANLAEQPTPGIYGQPSAALSGRPLLPLEGVVRLDETLGPMLGAKEAMATVVKAWRDRVSPKYSAMVGKAAANGLDKIQAVRVPDQGQLVQALQAELRRVYRAGQRSVVEEAERIESSPELAAAIAAGDVEVSQSGIEIEEYHEHHQCSLVFDKRSEPTPIGLKWLVSLLADPPTAPTSKPAKARKVKAPKPKAEGSSLADDVIPEDAIKAISDNTVQTTVSRMENEAMITAQAKSLGGAITADVAEASVLQVLEGLSLGPDLVQAQRDGNTIFGLGRIQEARAKDMSQGLYSTMLESNVCPACEKMDGATFPMEDVDSYATPNSDCYGGDACNCLILFIPKDS